MALRIEQPIFDLRHFKYEVETLTFDVEVKRILDVFQGLASLWWPENNDSKISVEKDPDISNRYNLYRTGDLMGFDGNDFNFELPKPVLYGYLEFTAATKDERQLIDVKLVCTRILISDFWDALVYNLKAIFAINFYKPKKARSVRKDRPRSSKNPSKVIESEKSQDEIYIPKRSAELRKWKFTYRLIQGWTQSDNEISRMLKERQKLRSYPAKYPTSPDTIAKIRKAGDAHKLD